tara:strand:- start:3853 stop:3975 length:123 start_codon:yes stop_codon:yes gene_type:complete
MILNKKRQNDKFESGILHDWLREKPPIIFRREDCVELIAE